MILDINNMFCEDQAITADAASTNTIDLGATGTPYGATAALVRDIGKGNCIPLTLCVTEAFNTLTSLTVELQVDDNSSFSSATTVASASYLLAALTLGKQLPFPDYVPEGTKERYLRLYFNCVGTDPTLGKITAGVVMGRQTNFIGGA